MFEFYIDKKLSQGLTRIQVDEVLPEQWGMPYIPQFLSEHHIPGHFLSLTIPLEKGIRYDHNSRISNKDFHISYFEPDLDVFGPNYQSPLSCSIKKHKHGNQQSYSHPSECLYGVLYRFT